MRLVLRPIGLPAAEYAAVTEEPVPRSLATYFEIRSLAFAGRPTIDRLPVSVRLAAVGNELKVRLTLISDVLRRLEALEWQVALVGDDVVVSTELSAELGWQKLNQQGIADHLLSLLQPGSDLPPGSVRNPLRRPRVRTERAPSA